MTTEAQSPAPAPEIDRYGQLFQDLFPSAILEAGKNAAGETLLSIAPDQVPLVLRQAKERPEMAYIFLRCITGVDREKQGIEVIYTIFSFKNRHTVHLKATLSPDRPTIQSITPFWLGADWHERELAEMFGVTFVGHPNPKHLLLDEDMTIHPLLKAHPLQPIELKQGVDTF